MSEDRTLPSGEMVTAYFASLQKYEATIKDLLKEIERQAKIQAEQPETNYVSSKMLLLADNLWEAVGAVIGLRININQQEFYPDKSDEILKAAQNFSRVCLQLSADIRQTLNRFLLEGFSYNLSRIGYMMFDQLPLRKLEEETIIEREDYQREESFRTQRAALEKIIQEREAPVEAKREGKKDAHTFSKVAKLFRRSSMPDITATRKMVDKCRSSYEIVVNFPTNIVDEALTIIGEHLQTLVDTLETLNKAYLDAQAVLKKMRGPIEKKQTAAEAKKNKMDEQTAEEVIQLCEKEEAVIKDAIKQNKKKGVPVVNSLLEMVWYQIEHGYTYQKIKDNIKIFLDAPRIPVRSDYIASISTTQSQMMLKPGASTAPPSKEKEESGSKKREVAAATL